ncbi:MAG: DUF4364 family protein [Eubacteriales bacterium]
MHQESHTLYKLIILYMLEKVSFSMTKSQISNFILEQEYTDFITLQNTIGELEDADLLVSETIGNRTYLTISEDGISTLSFFKNRLSTAIRNDIDIYLLENEFQLRNEVSILANYYKSSTSGEYEAHLLAKERDTIIVDMKLSVPLEEMAASICENWNKKNEQIYKYLTEQLF